MTNGGAEGLRVVLLSLSCSRPFAYVAWVQEDVMAEIAIDVRTVSTDDDLWPSVAELFPRPVTFSESVLHLCASVVQHI